MILASLHHQSNTFVMGKRSVKKVPFVELFNGRVQGVVSSGSDIERVYVSFLEARTFNFYCSTNNNRPCGGLGGSPCGHIISLVDEAIEQYGLEQVVKYLKLPATANPISSSPELFRALSGKTSQQKEPANAVFSRFLSYLSYLEYPAINQPLPEMSWFG